MAAGDAPVNAFGLNGPRTDASRAPAGRTRSIVVACFAGCLAYTEVRLSKRLLLRQIAKQEGASTDTNRDHEYTDWDKVRQLAGVVAANVKAVAPLTVVA